MTAGGRPLEIRPNCSSGLVPISVGNLAILSGIFLHNGAALALGLVLTLGPAALWIVLRHRAARVTLAQTAPEAVMEGETVTVTVSLTNRSGGTLHHPRFLEIFTPEEHAQKSVVFPRLVAPGETVQAGYRARCLAPRGVFGLGPAAIRISDPLGWFDVQGRLESHRTIRVLPRPVDFGVLTALARGDASARDDAVRRRAGDSEEIWSVRDYRPGDPQRLVHWRASARRGALVVREQARVEGGDTVYVLDLDRRAQGVGRRHGDFENALRLASALVADARRRGRALEVVSQEGVVLPRAAREVPLRERLDPLLELAPTSRRALAAFLARPTEAVARAGTLVVALHPHHAGDVALVAALTRLARGARVLAVLFGADAPGSRALAAGLRRGGVEVLVAGAPREAAAEAAS